MDEERTIFISYRREDSAHAAGRLYDRLSEHFGSDYIFMDMDTIELGDDFVDVIGAAVRSCDVLVTIIGNKWLTVTNADGQKRLEDPNDFVRLEIVSALDQNVDVVPILLDDAVMPRAEDLPEMLVPLIRRNALAVEYSRFNADVDRLIRGIEAIFIARAEKEAAEAELAEVKQLVAERTEAHSIAKKRAAQTEIKKTKRGSSGQISAPAQDAVSKKTRQLIVLIVTLGWFISGIIFWVTYLYMYDNNSDMGPPLLPGALGGIMGAVVIGIALKRIALNVEWDILIFFAIGWTTAVVIGWSTSFAWGDIQIQNGIPTGGALGGVVVGLSTGYMLSRVLNDIQWKNIIIISIGWSLAWAIGLAIHYQLFDEYGSSLTTWFFSFLLTTVIIGSLLLWQIAKLGQQELSVST